MTNEEHNKVIKENSEKKYSWEEMSITPGVYYSVRFENYDISFVCIRRGQVLFVSKNVVEVADDGWQDETFKKLNKKITIQFENE